MWMSSFLSRLPSTRSKTFIVIARFIRFRVCLAIANPKRLLKRMTLGILVRVFNEGQVCRARIDLYLMSHTPKKSMRPCRMHPD